MKPIRPNIAKGATYPTEFREEAVRYWLSSGHTLAAVAADLGLSPECLRSWRRQMETPDGQVLGGNGLNGQAASANDLTLAREIGQLRRELEAMTSCPEGTQRDILKKAISPAHLWAPVSDDKTLSGGLK